MLGTFLCLEIEKIDYLSRPDTPVIKAVHMIKFEYF